ncbi:hypothetical protein RhiirA4_463213 [Rhizophagus irregularis]|uniref:Uncharacterized protein n=1 Tax=Rhizophagus irregularis TaxID=588596 RepID=A0A2I1GMG3_9GLOM|nr:hypothetical protein RhiirA4_463213 [Rhizophagus irregularis]
MKEKAEKVLVHIMVVEVEVSREIRKLVQNHLFRRPMIIQTITGTLFVTGDIIAQQFVEQRGLKSHNFYRTLRLGEFGLCIASPSTDPRLSGIVL